MQVRVVLGGFLVTATGLAGLGSLGVVSAVRDRASTGENGVSSAGEARPDIQLAAWAAGGCGEFEEDLWMPVVELESTSIGAVGGSIVCLRNVGRRSGSVAVTTADLVSTEITCDEVEAATDDTCSDGDVGELEHLLDVELVLVDCDTAQPTGPALNGWLDNMGPNPFGIVDELAPEETVCVEMAVEHVAAPISFPPSPISDADVLSDSVSWRFVFEVDA